jgi:tRNA pseudouridine32 synthase / 23S rRNA pseudouridine746 synthase
MDNSFLFKFKTDISSINISLKLNNPFSASVPEIARIAAKEFQEFIALESEKWNYDFYTKRGKMFGVLVVQKTDNTYCYLGTVSGKLPNNIICNKFVPSVFDNSIDDFFINKRMIELTEIGSQIKNSNSPSEINELKETRKQKSVALQRQLFENYHFLNLLGEQKNILEIFKTSSHGNPPAASGECAAPKLLQYAIEHKLKPIAIAEFWWGSATENKDKKHINYYPACKNRCRPILEYILEDNKLFINQSENRKAK